MITHQYHHPHAVLVTLPGGVEFFVDAVEGTDEEVGQGLCGLMFEAGRLSVLQTYSVLVPRPHTADCYWNRGLDCDCGGVTPWGVAP